MTECGQKLREVFSKYREIRFDTRFLNNVYEEITTGELLDSDHFQSDEDIRGTPAYSKNRAHEFFEEAFETVKQYHTAALKEWVKTDEQMYKLAGALVLTDAAYVAKKGQDPKRFLELSLSLFNSNLVKGIDDSYRTTRSFHDMAKQLSEHGYDANKYLELLSKYDDMGLVKDAYRNSMCIFFEQSHSATGAHDPNVFLEGTFETVKYLKDHESVLKCFWNPKYINRLKQIGPSGLSDKKLAGFFNYHGEIARKLIEETGDFSSSVLPSPEDLYSDCFRKKKSADEVVADHLKKCESKKRTDMNVKMRKESEEEELRRFASSL